MRESLQSVTRCPYNGVVWVISAPDGVQFYRPQKSSDAWWPLVTAIFADKRPILPLSLRFFTGPSRLPPGTLRPAPSLHHWTGGNDGLRRSNCQRKRVLSDGRMVQWFKNSLTAVTRDFAFWFSADRQSVFTQRTVDRTNQHNALFATL